MDAIKAMSPGDATSCPLTTFKHSCHPRAGATPGLTELYLTAMDAIEALSPGDALFMVQGSTAAEAEGPGGARRDNGFGLTAGAWGARCCSPFDRRLQ